MDHSPGRRKHKKNFYLLITLTIMLVLLLVACRSETPTPEPVPTAEEALPMPTLAPIEGDPVTDMPLTSSRQPKVASLKAVRNNDPEPYVLPGLRGPPRYPVFTTDY